MNLLASSRKSNLTGRDHLFSQVGLILANCTIPPLDSLMFADHDVFGDLIEQSSKREYQRSKALKPVKEWKAYLKS